MKQVLDRFREGKINILVATNVAQDGIHIPECSLVINYERNMTEVDILQSEGIKTIMQEIIEAGPV